MWGDATGCGGKEDMERRVVEGKINAVRKVLSTSRIGRRLGEPYSRQKLEAAKLQTPGVCGDMCGDTETCRGSTVDCCYPLLSIICDNDLLEESTASRTLRVHRSTYTQSVARSLSLNVTLCKIFVNVQ